VEVVLGNCNKEGLPDDLVFELETASSTESDDGEVVLGVSYPSPPRNLKHEEENHHHQSIITTPMEQQQQNQESHMNDIELTNISLTSIPSVVSTVREGTLESIPSQQNTLEDNKIPQPQDKLSNKNNDTSETVDITNNTTTTTTTSNNGSCSPNCSSRKQHQQPTLSRKLSNGLSNQINRLTNNGSDMNGGRYIVSPTEESDSDDLHSVEEGHSAKAIV